MTWVAIGLGALAPAMGLVLYIYEAIVRPSRIPSEEIEALADAMERSHPDDPDYGAFVEEQAAWFRSDLYEQGRWDRVRKALRTRRSQRP